MISKRLTLFRETIFQQNFLARGIERRRPRRDIRRWAATVNLDRIKAEICCGLRVLNNVAAIRSAAGGSVAVIDVAARKLSRFGAPAVVPVPDSDSRENKPRAADERVMIKRERERERELASPS